MVEHFKNPAGINKKSNKQARFINEIFFIFVLVKSKQKILKVKALYCVLFRPACIALAIIRQEIAGNPVPIPAFSYGLLSKHTFV